MKYIAILLFGLCAIKATAAAGPCYYSQYFNNPMFINPAPLRKHRAALRRTRLPKSVGGGIDGGPRPSTSMHMPLTNQNLAVGAIAMGQDWRPEEHHLQPGSVACCRIKLRSRVHSLLG